MRQESLGLGIGQVPITSSYRVTSISQVGHLKPESVT